MIRKDQSLRQVKRRFISILDQRTGKEKRILKEYVEAINNILKKRKNKKKNS